MRRVVLESPYSSANGFAVESNLQYARHCVRDCLKRGEAPIASHLLFTQPWILDDNKPVERSLGMEAGWAWYAVAEACVVYTDRGISQGMKDGIARALSHMKIVEYRKLGP